MLYCLQYLRRTSAHQSDRGCKILYRFICAFCETPAPQFSHYYLAFSFINALILRGKPNKLMKPAASAWLYTSSSSNVTKSSLYKEYGEVAPAEIMLPFVQFKFYFTSYSFLSFINECLQSVHQWCEPHAIVYKFSVFC